MNPRTHAARILHQVIHQQRSLATAITHYQQQHAEITQLSWIKEVCYGVCRWYYQLTWIKQQLLTKPLKAKDAIIDIIILIGLYQLNYMQTPDHASVTETVNAVTQLKKPWAKGLVNGVLRTYLRQQQNLQATLITDEVAHYAHPAWLIHYIKHAWPQHWQTILNANNSYPPLTLRVNQQKINRNKYLTQLQAAGITAEPTKISSVGITLTKAIDVTQLPGFIDGLGSVQDEAAQCAAYLLDLQPQQRVLDACAAPGGKSAHILETQPQLNELVAIDHDQQRLQLINNNLQRLNLTATTICADARKLDSWWDGKPFNRILLDAPCSATGVIRRHPDIKLLRRETDITQLAATQLQLLTQLWQTLANHGKLLYATCSLLPAENDQVIAAALKKLAHIKIEPINISQSIATEFGCQLLPQAKQTDGFYYCLLTKT